MEMIAQKGDMTRGSCMKALLRFSLPIMMGLLFQQFYNMADTIIVGQYIGVEALAAVGSVSTIHFMIVGISSGICDGFAIPIAQNFGAKQYGMMRRYVANAMFLALLIGTVLAVVLCGTLGPILTVMKTPDALRSSAYAYMWIILAGLPAMYLYNMSAGMLRAIGNSRLPVVFLIVSSVGNILLDLLFVLKFKMGVEGAAAATVLAQAAAGVGCLVCGMQTREIVRPGAEERKIKGSMIRHLLAMGLPMGLQFSITGLGGLILQANVNLLGTAAVAAVTAGGKIHGLFNSFYQALGSAMATFAGQNTGARKPDRITEGLKSAFVIGCIYWAIALLIVWLAGENVIHLFIEDSQVEITQKALWFIKANSSLYAFICLVNIVRFAVQGMGYSNLAVMAGVFELAARTGVCLLFIPQFGYNAVCFADPAAWILADVFLVPAYLVCLNNERKKLDI